jgi:hypothetical protein
MATSAPSLRGKACIRHPPHPFSWEIIMRNFGKAHCAATGVRLFVLLVLALAANPPTRAAAQSRFFTFERNVDRPGLDFRNAPSSGASDCSFKCQLENQCRAFTFVRPGVQGPSGRCFLKRAVPVASRNRCCTSGVRRGAPVIID